MKATAISRTAFYLVHAFCDAGEEEAQAAQGHDVTVGRRPWDVPERRE